MGFPVIRKPHPFDRLGRIGFVFTLLLRVREGARIKKSTSEDYPYIQV